MGNRPHCDNGEAEASIPLASALPAAIPPWTSMLVTVVVRIGVGITPFQGYQLTGLKNPGLRPGLSNDAPSVLQRPSALSSFPESGTTSKLDDL